MQTLTRAFATLREAITRRHTFVIATALFSTWGAIYSALGGAFFNVVPLTFNESATVTAYHIGRWNESAYWPNPTPTFYAVGVCISHTPIDLIGVTHALSHQYAGIAGDRILHNSPKIVNKHIARIRIV